MVGLFLDESVVSGTLSLKQGSHELVVVQSFGISRKDVIILYSKVMMIIGTLKSKNYCNYFSFWNEIAKVLIIHIYFPIILG